MIHKKIHTQVKRAHAHIQNHGHKRLWILSVVFLIILVYPYFSNAQQGEDLCPNIDGIQEVLAANYEVDGNGDCVCETGFDLDGENNCVEIPQEPTTADLCPNIDGDQESLPENYIVDGEDNCICAEGFEPDGEGNCVAIQDVLDEESIPLTGTITYDPSTSITGPVTATLTGFSTTGVTITNNSGDNTKIFTENGSFEFLFENDQGTTGSATAMVDWIVEDTSNQNCEISITSPFSDDIVSGSFPIQRESNTYCNDENITIQLRDHNNQRISIGTGLLYDEEFIFASTGLTQTGLYTITGIHLSGTQREIIEDLIVVDSGTYTQDTIYTIYTGSYIGAYTNYAIGYQVRIVDANQQVLAESDALFTIDNQIPVLSNFSLGFAPVVAGKIGKPGIMTASFTVSEQLTGTTTFTILGTNVTPSSGSQNGNVYSYTIPLTTVVASGALVFTAHVTDLAGNPGALYGTSYIVLDNHIPQISNFAMSGSVPSLQLSRQTDVQTMYSITVNTGEVFSGSTYGTAHNYTIQNTQYSGSYAFTLAVSDILGNTKVLSGDIEISGSGGLSIQFHQAENNILQLSEEVETNLYLQILQTEVSKFQACKALLTYTNQNIPIQNKNITLQIPAMTKERVKNAMGAFLLLFANKIKNRSDLSQAELDNIANAINNFLVVVRLTDDQDNLCEQKMGNYYMGAFKSMMDQMNFF